MLIKRDYNISELISYVDDILKNHATIWFPEGEKMVEVKQVLKELVLLESVEDLVKGAVRGGEVFNNSVNHCILDKVREEAIETIILINHAEELETVGSLEDFSSYPEYTMTASDIVNFFLCRERNGYRKVDPDRVSRLGDIKRLFSTLNTFSEKHWDSRKSIGYYIDGAIETIESLYHERNILKEKWDKMCTELLKYKEKYGDFTCDDQ